MVERYVRDVEAAGSNPVTSTKQTLLYMCNGGIAQLGEHLPYKQGVTGSSPVVPTKCKKPQFTVAFLFICFKFIMYLKFKKSAFSE